MTMRVEVTDEELALILEALDEAHAYQALAIKLRRKEEQ